jgi:hypothetical protein
MFNYWQMIHVLFSRLHHWGKTNVCIVLSAFCVGILCFLHIKLLCPLIKLRNKEIVYDQLLSNLLMNSIAGREAGAAQTVRESSHSNQRKH